MKRQTKITVYFDGLCKVCSREMAHYQKQAGSEKIRFIDICAVGFDPSKEGVDPVAVHNVMHVRRVDGTLAIRVDAFIEIWQALPKYKFLAKISKNLLVYDCLEIGYSLFVKIRPLLPRYKSKADCASSPFCEVEHG